MRKRCGIDDLPEVERPSGTLKGNELEEIRQAYRDGCKGEILIGLRGEERVITMLLPAQADNEAMELLLRQIKERLKTMGCGRLIRIKRKLEPCIAL